MSDTFNHALDALDGEEWKGATWRPRTKVCRRCNTPGLHWQETAFGYRLYDRYGMLHVCPKKDGPPLDYRDQMEAEYNRLFCAGREVRGE